MSSIRVCECSRSCQAGGSCVRVPRFQVHLDARCPPVHKSAEACADHLGSVVIALTVWARQCDLAEAELTVLAIGPPTQDGQPCQAPSPGSLETCGFVFSTIRLAEHGNAGGVVEMGKAQPPAR